MLPDNILFSDDPAKDLNGFLIRKKPGKVVVLVDENTLSNCYHLIQPGLPEHVLIKVKSGEEEKNLNTCTDIWQNMTDHQLDRHACMIVLGGGVLGDMGGFCAATYKRGIDFVLVPTTLLAQADASIGGKLGVDFNNYKNHIGVFRLPALTLLHSGFLKTLPAEELRSGFAEVIKHTLIADKAMWKNISSSPLTGQSWDTLIRHSVSFKAQVTTQDPTEHGLRKILNAGHTVGHALETYLLNTGNRVLHGEAIAAGLIAEGYIAYKRGQIDKDDFLQMNTYILSIYGKINFKQEDSDSIIRLMLQDKKNKDNKLLCVLQKGIGSAGWDYEISTEEVRRSLEFYLAL